MPGQVEFALHQPLRALIVGIVGGADRALADVRQAGTDHGQQLGVDTGSRQQLPDTGALFRLDVDDEAVRRIRRQGLLPGTEQFAADDRQQQHGHQPDRQRRHLQRIGGAMAPQAGQPLSPAGTSAATNSAEQRNPAPRQSPENQQCHEKAAGRNQPEPDIAGNDHNQRRQQAEADDESQALRAAGRPEIAPQDAQRGHARQLQQRGQGEAEQQHKGDRYAMHDRQPLCRRQGDSQQAPKRADQDMVRGETDQGADQGSKQRQPAKL